MQFNATENACSHFFGEKRPKSTLSNGNPRNHTLDKIIERITLHASGWLKLATLSSV